jgi:ABC-type lipoprotein export system ATPase subunit
MLKLENVSRIYDKHSKNEQVSLNGISLIFPDMGMVFIVGKSGCGKTTLLNLLAKLDFPDTGEIYVDGKSHFTSAEADGYRNGYISIIFQEFNLLNDLTVGENLKLVREINGETMSDGEVEEYLQRVSMGGLASRPVTHLSGGQKQRAAIARALAENPKIVFADEPTGSLDNKNGTAVLEILKALSRERLVVVISHDTEAAQKYADRIIMLSDGRVIEDTVPNPAYVPDAVVTDTEIIIPSDAALSGDIASAINKRGDKKVVRSAEPRYMPFNGAVLDKAAEYKAPPKTKLPHKTAWRLAASKISRHKLRFSVSIVIIAVSLMMFGVSSVLSTYNIGEVFADNFERFSEPGLIISKGEGLPPFGYVSRTWSRNMHPADKKIAENSGVTGGLDEFYVIDYEMYGYGATDTGSDFLRQNFNGYFETTEGRLNSNYGYTVLAGEFPADSQRDENGLLHVAITDYTCFLISAYGAYTADGQSLLNITPALLVGKTLRVKAESIYIAAVIKTDFDNYRELLLKTPAGISDLDAARLEFLVYRYYHRFYVAPGMHEHFYAQTAVYGKRQYMSYSFFNELMSDERNAQSKIVFKDGVTPGAPKPGEIIISAALFRSLFRRDFNPQATEDAVFNEQRYFRDEWQTIRVGGYKVIGVFTGNLSGDALFDGKTPVVFEDTDFATAANGNSLPSSFHIKMPDTRVECIALVNYLDDNTFYQESSLFYFTYNVYNDLTMCATIFRWTGILFAVICVLFIVNFMMSSIRDRQNEMGILRSLGVRGGGVSKIFADQAVIVFLLSAVIAVLGIIIGTFGVNFILQEHFAKTLDTDIINYISLYRLSAPPFIYTLLLLLAITAVATALPTLRLIRMKPADCLRD